MFRAVANPALFPAFVAQHSLAFEADALADLPGLLDGTALPPSLRGAVPKRQLEFAAGRRCAVQALRALDPCAATTAVAVAPDRSPAWPAGIVGTITHAHGFASAAVARLADAAGIGLDSERIVPADTARDVANSIARADELARLVAQSGADEPLVLTAVFSAKESIFKCLYRHVGRYFDFLDVALTSIDFGDGRFAGRLLQTLTERLPAGMELDGRLVVDGDRVHSSTILPP